MQVLDSQGKQKIALCSNVEEGAERGRFSFWASSENPHDIQVVDFKRCKILALSLVILTLNEASETKQRKVMYNVDTIRDIMRDQHFFKLQ